MDANKKFNGVICLMGPTASGKTELAVKLSERFPIEIVSVDSAKIYRGMDIGTAKPPLKVLDCIPHHLINTHDPSQIYSAGKFREDATVAIEQILSRKRIPLLVGGSMLYFHVLQQGMSNLPQSDFLVREHLKKLLTELGIKKLYERLAQRDPFAANRIHPHNCQRVLRALEIMEITGKTLTELHKHSPPHRSAYTFFNIALIPHRNQLSQRIESRFQKMLHLGFIEEVEKLFKRGDLDENLPAIRSVGYRQVWSYLMGNISFITMQSTALTATKQLAKKQFTWLRSWKKLYLLEDSSKENVQKVVELIKKITDKKHP